MISERISDDIPPQMKILNIVIPNSNALFTFSFKRTAKMYFIAPIRPAATSSPAAYIHLSANEKRRS